MTHGCDVSARGGDYGEVGVLLCFKHVNILQLAGCVWYQRTFVLRFRLQVLFLGLQKLSVAVRVREIFFPLACLVREIPNIDHLHLVDLMLVKTSKIPRRIVLLAVLRENAVHVRFLGFAADLGFPRDTTGPVAETVHAHADGADAVWFLAVDYFPGHARQQGLHADVVVVVVPHDSFAEEVVAFRRQGQGHLVVPHGLMLVIQHKPAFSSVKPVWLSLPSRAMGRFVLEEDVGPVAALFAPTRMRLVETGYVVMRSISLESRMGIERWRVLSYPHVSIIVVVDRQVVLPLCLVIVRDQLDGCVEDCCGGDQGLSHGRELPRVNPSWWHAVLV